MTRSVIVRTVLGAISLVGDGPLKARQKSLRTFGVRESGEQFMKSSIVMALHEVAQFVR